MDSMLNKNKERLYIGLYNPNRMRIDELSPPRPNKPCKAEELEWVLLIAPKEEGKGALVKRYMLCQDLDASSRNERVWKLHFGYFPMRRFDGIVARILVAKITNRDALDGVLCGSGASVDGLVSGSPIEGPRTPTTWVENMLKAFKNAKCCKHLPEWQDIKEKCVDFGNKTLDTNGGEVETISIMVHGSSGRSGTKRPAEFDDEDLKRATDKSMQT